MNIENVEECVADCQRKRSRLPGWVIADAFTWAAKRREDPNASPEELQRAMAAMIAMVQATAERHGPRKDSSEVTNDE